MSAKAINWAWRQTGLTPVEKCALMALADFHTDSSGCFPSVKSICEKANIKKTAALKALATLEKMGFIQKETRRGKLNNHISNNYSLCFNDKHATPSPLNAPPPSSLNTPPLVRKKNQTPSPLNAPPSPLNGPKHIEDNYSDTKYLGDPLKEFAEIAPVDQSHSTDLGEVRGVQNTPRILTELVECAVDPVKIFWDEALRKLRNMAVPEHKSRVMIGKWLKQTGDDRDAVMAAIDRAVEVGTMEPVSYIVKSLDKKSFTPHKEQKRKEWNDALEWLKAKDQERKSKGGSDDPRGSDRDDHGGVSDVEHNKSPKVRRTRRSGSGAVPAADAGETGGPVHGDPVEGQVHAVDSGIDF